MWPSCPHPKLGSPSSVPYYRKARCHRSSSPSPTLVCGALVLALWPAWTRLSHQSGSLRRGAVLLVLLPMRTEKRSGQRAGRLGAPLLHEQIRSRTSFKRDRGRKMCLSRWDSMTMACRALAPCMCGCALAASIIGAATAAFLAPSPSSSVAWSSTLFSHTCCRRSLNATASYLLSPEGFEVLPIVDSRGHRITFVLENRGKRT